MTGWINGTILMWVAALVAAWLAAMYALEAICAKAAENAQRMSDRKACQRVWRLSHRTHIDERRRRNP